MPDDSSFRTDLIYDQKTVAGLHDFRIGTSVSKRGNNLQVSGDDTGEHSILVYADPKKLGVYSSYELLVADLMAGGTCHISQPAVQFLLRFGFIPYPFSPYEHVWSLGIGDRFEFDLQNFEGHYYVDFPYFRKNSRENVTFEVDALKEVLARSIERRLNSDGDMFVMQSAGKDSTSMMIALQSVRQSGVLAITYDANTQQEGDIAGSIAKRLGFRHQIVRADPVAECNAFLEFCDKFPSLSCDHTIAAYCHSLKTVGVRNTTVIDGSGNDGYMGYLPTRKEMQKFRLCGAQYFSPLWGLFEERLLFAHVPNWEHLVVSYPVELFFPGAMLSKRAIRDLTGPIRTSHFYEKTKRYSRKLHPLDSKAYFRGRLYDHCSISQKIKLSLTACQSKPLFPYCDQQVIDYYFNLPERDRYDFPNFINKVGLRRFCESELGSSYLEYVSRKKGFFKYDMDGFIRKNISTIRSEILGGVTSLRNVEKWWRFFSTRIDKSHFCQELFYLFCVSAWLNRRPKGVSIDFALTASLRDSIPKIQMDF